MKKTTRSKLSKQLTKYSALTAAIVGVADANGQINYTDVNPDFVGGPGGEYLLDIDNNGTNDFRIYHNGALSASSAAILIQPLTASNEVLGSDSGFYAYPFVLNSGDTISSGQTSWNNTGFSSGFQSLNYGVSCGIGNWCGVTDGFIGLRFNIAGSGIHYGWARLDVPNDNSQPWTIKDIAYNLTVNESLLAGQQVLDVDSNDFEEIRVVSLNKTIGLYNLQENINYRLINVEGKNVLSGSTDNAQNTVIEASGFATGVYIIELQGIDSNSIKRKKIVL